jgi:hypothetical protein
MPHQGSTLAIEPKGASVQIPIPEPSNIRGTSGPGRMPHVSLDSSQSFNTAHPTDTVPSAPISTIPLPSSCFSIPGVSIRTAAKAWIEQEEVEFRATKESVEAEISRLQSLIAEQKVTLDKARGKRDKNIEKARGIIEGKGETLRTGEEPFATAPSQHDILAVDSAPKVLYSISSIPPELLLPIFALVDMEWTPLRLVCKQWNSIILNHGNFWSDIVLTSRPDSANPGLFGGVPWQPRQQLCRSLSAVEEALCRSKSAPLSITVDFVDFAGKPLDTDKFGDTSFNAGPQRVQKRRDAVKLVGKEISRIRTLSVFATGGIKKDTVEGSFEPEQAGILEKLYINGRMYDTSDDDMQFSRLISAANVRTLRFLDCPTDPLRGSTPLEWSGFVDISVKRLFIDWEGLVTPLTLPNLRILRLGGWSIETLRKLRTPRLDSLVVRDSPPFFVPDDVTHLAPVDVLSATSLHLWCDFSILVVLNVPTVTHIDLQSDRDHGQEMDNGWITTIFKEAEVQFPNLISLVLCTFASSGSISKGLEHLPQLVDLCVDAKHKRLAAVFWNNLTRTVKRVEGIKAPKIVPNLKRLHVRLHHERTPAIEGLATKVKAAREEAEQSLTLLVVEWKDGEVSNIVGGRRQGGNAATFPRKR